MSAAGQTIKLKPDSLTWIDNALSAELETTNGIVLCVIPRDTINCLPAYGDLVEWEIERLKVEIFNRLSPAIGAKLQLGHVERADAEPTVCLRPADLAPGG
jgi:hypothetical protein